MLCLKERNFNAVNVTTCNMITWQLLLLVEKVYLLDGPLVVLVSGAVRTALFTERVVVPLYFLLHFVSLVVGCQSLRTNVTLHSLSNKELQIEFWR